MANTQFTFRRYVETDADVIYEAYVKFAQSNIQPYVSGPSVVLVKSEFLDKFQKFSVKQHRPPIIATTDDIPCGIYQINYNHANRYYELWIYLWSNTHFARAVLKEVIDQVLSPSQYLLAEIPGYAPELKQAADDLGLDLVGKIPNYLPHDEELHHKYSYITTFEKWHSIKD